jgi:outer membrane protein TolC
MQKSLVLLGVAVFLVGIKELQETAKASPPGSAPQKVVQPAHSPVHQSASKPAFFDLQGYIKAVLSQDPGLIAARLAQMSNEKETQSVRAEYLPELKAYGEVGVLDGANRFGLFAPTSTQETVRNPDTHTTQTVNEPRTFETIHWAGYSVFGPTLTMPFFKDGSFLGINTPPAENIKRAEGQALAASARLDAQEVTFRATDIFLRAVSTSNLAKILRDHLDWIQKQNDLIHEQAKYSLVSQADVIVADTKLAETKIDVLIAGQRAVDAFFRVGEFIGIDDPRVVRIDTKYPQVKPLPSFESTVLRANVDHPRIELQQAQANKADAALALRRAQLWPEGKVVSAYRVGNNLEEVGQARWTSFLAVSVPIFDFGERYYALKAADLKLQEEKELIVKAHQEVRQAVFDAFSHLREALEAQTGVTALVAERQHAVDRLEELAKYERAPVPQLITAQLALLEAKRSEEAVHVAVLLASADLERATAGEWRWIR